MAITTGGTVQALLLCKEVAAQLKVPMIWVTPTIYKKAAGGGSKK
jgi:hypothetical protein